MNPEILTKLKEIEALIHLEDNADGKTISDFFKPTAHRMMETMKWRMKEEINQLGTWDDTKKAMLKIVDKIFWSITPESFLDFHSGVYEDQPWMGEIKSALRRGSKLEAVKIFKMNTVCGLKESKDYIDMMVSKNLF